MQDVNIEREEEIRMDDSESWALPIIQYAYERKKISDETIRMCPSCGIEKLGSEFYGGQGKCKRCTYEAAKERHRIHPVKSQFVPVERPFCGNKDCGGYLGVHIAETVLSKVFEGVTRCKLHNHGYDFVCSKGYKIDVKAACLRTNRGWKYWSFLIRKNKIADYFLCLAFDSRDTLNPEHLWLIPGSAINNFQTIDISRRTLIKWSQYELPLEKVQESCFAFRQEVKANATN